MDHQVEERLFLHLRHIGRNRDHIFGTSGKLPVFLQQVLQKELHVIEPGDHPVLHGKNDFDIRRSLLIHLIGFVSNRKNLLLVADGDHVFLFPDGILLFIIDFDLIGTKIQSVGISGH